LQVAALATVSDRACRGEKWWRRRLSGPLFSIASSRLARRQPGPGALAGARAAAAAAAGDRCLCRQLVPQAPPPTLTPRLQAAGGAHSGPRGDAVGHYWQGLARHW
jgi:hypothetical protein